MIEEKDLDEILTQVWIEVKQDLGKENISEVVRRTGIPRQKVRTWKKNGYHLCSNKGGRPAGSLKLQPYQCKLNELLSSGVSNSSVCYDRIKEMGYSGGLTIVKDYISAHRDLIPAKRKLIVEPQGNRGRRYYTEPGDCYQMDWGFVNVVDSEGNSWRCACFAMVCHHCGFRYVEFFPNATQENLFIGMIHAFLIMGIPNRVLTDNMKSVVIRRDAAGAPIYNKEYDEFQHALGFRTDLCKVKHPFTKGKVERLVRYVKENFCAGQTFLNITDLNQKALQWCFTKNSNPIKGYEHIPMDEHMSADLLRPLKKSVLLLPYLAPMRKISFDGFVHYEGRQFGVPYRYAGRSVRVMRDSSKLYIIDPDTNMELQQYDVDWSKKAKVCEGQWSEYRNQPEEKPTAPVATSIRVIDQKSRSRFDRFRFPASRGKEVEG